METLQVLLVLLGAGIFLLANGIANRYGRKSAKEFHIEYIFYFGCAACFSSIGLLMICFALTDFPENFPQFFG